MPYARVNDISMYYEEHGKGQPIIFMHGATGSLEQADNSWSGLSGLLGQKYKAIHVEHRGHGRTNNPRDYLTYELIADDICKFIEEKKIGPVHIAGLSDGAIVGLHISMTRPDLMRTLICVGVNYYNDDLVREANEFADVEKIERKQPELATLFATVHDRNKTPGYWKTLIKHLAINLAKNPAYTIEDLKKTKTPTLLIAGENDLWANRQQMIDMRKHMPASELLIINNAGHEAQYSHPHLVGPAMMDFLERHKDYAHAKRQS